MLMCVKCVQVCRQRRLDTAQELRATRAKPQLRKPGEHLQFNRSFFQRAIVAPFLSETLRPAGSGVDVPVNLVEADRRRS